MSFFNEDELMHNFVTVEEKGNDNMEMNLMGSL